MKEKISVVICTDYKLELDSILSQEGFEDFTTFYKSSNQKGPGNCVYDEEFINNVKEKNKSTHIIGGSCLSITHKEYSKYDGIHVHKVSHCLYYLASKSIVDGLQNQGAYLVSPGWLNSWQKKINDWGFDQQTAQEFFRETTSKIVLLDSGVYDNSDEQLKAFAEFLDQPFDSLYVGLDHFKMYLKMVMCNFKEKHANDQIEVNQPNNETANYAMALELVRQLSESKSASETITQTKDIFTMLFSPEIILFHSMVESSSVEKKYFQYEDVTFLTENSQGFFVKVEVNREVYGVFEIINIAHPQYLSEYRNLTLNLIGVVNLALEEASYKEKLLWTTTKLTEVELTRDLALEAAKVGVYNWDIKNNNLIWDAIVYKLYGEPDEKKSGDYETWTSFLHPDDKEEAIKDVQLALSGEKEYNSEFRIIWQNNSVHYINARAAIIRDTEGEPVRMLGLNWDITERKILEEELRQYSLMVKSVHDSIIVVDLNWEITHWNMGSEKIFGYSEAEALGQRTSVLLNVEDIGAVVRNVLPSTGYWSDEVKFVRKDLTTGYISSTFVAMNDVRGNKIGYLGINRDITARKIAEEELMLQSEIMKNMAEGVSLVGAEDGIMKYSNPKFEEMFGYKQGEIIGHHVSILNAPTIKEPLETAEEIMEILNTFGLWHGEIENIKKDGTHFWCEAYVSVFNHHQHGKVLVAVHSDITERKKSEEKLKALTIDLENQKKQLELLASTDSLTGLLNRRFFLEQIKSEVGRQRRSGKSFSIIICDIDKFKNINDTYGHPFGDSVLVKVTDILKKNIREQDSIGRWGGEEFIFLLPETDIEGAFFLAEMLRKKLETSKHYFEDELVTVTSTFGISQCKSDHDYLESIKKADLALYEGKSAGRNCVIKEKLL